MRSIREYQTELARRGYYDGAPDGLFGERSLAALNQYLKDMGRPQVASLKDKTSLAKALAFFYPELEKKVEVKDNWATTLVGSTGFKYLLTIVCTWAASKLGLDSASLQGVVLQILALVPALWGMWEASRSKIVVNGAKVAVKELSSQDKATVAAIVAKNQ